MLDDRRKQWTAADVVDAPALIAEKLNLWAEIEDEIVRLRAAEFRHDRKAFSASLDRLYRAVSSSG